MRYLDVVMLNSGGPRMTVVDRKGRVLTVRIGVLFDAFDARMVRRVGAEQLS